MKKFKPFSIDVTESEELKSILNEIEVMQKYTDPAPTTCESCGKGPMVKQLSLSSFALKGTGWYVTDFRGGDSGAPQAKDSLAPTASKSDTQVAAPAPKADSVAAAPSPSAPVASAPAASSSGKAD